MALRGAARRGARAQAVKGVFNLQQPVRRRGHQFIDRIRTDRQRLEKGALKEAVGVSCAATSAGAALTVHDLSVGCRAHDMLSGPIKAVVLHVHGEVTLIAAQVIEVT